MNYLFFAYSIIWALVVGYIFILGKRQKELKKEIRQLEEWNSEN